MLLYLYVKRCKRKYINILLYAYFLFPYLYL